MKTPSTLIACIFFATIIFGCESKTKQKNSAQEHTSASQSKIIKLSPDDITPAFRRDTVIKLNAIVSKQLEVITEFDRVKNLYKHNDRTSEKEKTQYYSVISRLVAQAKANEKDLMDAKYQLDQSGEHYNKPTLAGMISFVKDVEQEISNYNKSLSKS